MQEIIKEVPKGFYERILCVVVPIGDNVKLLEEHHKDLIEYWISINGYKLMIPIWFYNNICILKRKTIQLKMVEYIIHSLFERLILILCTWR